MPKELCPHCRREGGVCKFRVWTNQVIEDRQMNDDEKAGRIEGYRVSAKFDLKCPIADEVKNPYL